jgi:predicted butyrate kinase (DUF1464 family)
MEVKKITGIVEQITSETKSVKVSGVWFSGRFSYEGSLPNVGDEVELTLTSSVSKKDNKTYFNITEIKVLKEAPKQTTREDSIIAQCLAKIAFNEPITYDPKVVFTGYIKFLELLNESK